jgi:uncharacterized membrane protein YebE (DUF533 family)
MKRLTVSGRACGETLAILIAMAWADGKLEAAEKDGILGASKVFNLTKETRDKIDTLLEAKASVGELAIGDLTAREKAFAYVAAAWMAGVDDEVDPKETDALGELAKKLGLGEAEVKELAAVSEKLEPLPEGKRSWSEHITALFKAIPAHLEEEALDEFEVVFE